MTQRCKMSACFAATIVLCACSICLAQQNSGTGSWSTDGQHGDAQGNTNPTRSLETHRQVNGRAVDRTAFEAMGPDGRYIPYSETEKESVRVDATTVRTIERTFARGPDGQRTLIQQTQEESRTLPGGEKKIERTTSNPDADGKLQVMRRELSDSKQVSAEVRTANTTVFSADGSGGMSAAVKTEEVEKKTDTGTVQFRKSTSLADGTGRWTLSEVREGTTRQESGRGVTKDESVMRPDAEGRLAVIERTVSKQAAGAGETRETTERYSTNVPGEAGSNGLQLVGRETTIHRTTAGGAQSTSRQVERPNPGDPASGLHLTQETIDIVRPNGSGTAEEKSTTVDLSPDGQVNTVWVDTGKTDNPSVVHVETTGPPKKK